MPSFEVSTKIEAPSEICFDLSRDIGFHVRSLEHTNEKVVARRTDGLIGLDESVTWEARHLGLTRTMTVQITAMDRPYHFQDKQTKGPFRHFVHDHLFDNLGKGVTRMRDVISFASPHGPLGRMVDRVYLAGYLQRLIATRGQAIKAEAERITQQNQS